MYRTKFFILFILILNSYAFFAQEYQSLYKNETFLPTSTTIRLSNQSLNPDFFEVLLENNQKISADLYSIDFSSGLLIFKEDFFKYIADNQITITVNYLIYPEFLTKKYSKVAEESIVEDSEFEGYKYSFSQHNTTNFSPFDGLYTSGSLSRGITVGNNQNAVTNSSLDLQIQGQLTDNVTIKASLQDSNIPIQDGGYSQKLDEFDQIFIEIDARKWQIRAGDLFLENRKNKFLNFNKKVQGISSRFFLDKNQQTSALGSVALVKGQYAKSSFVGLEGNQGPYKLKGSNQELYILIISGSERVFVNGILLQRGEDKHYIIDYNAGEITFTTLFPVTADMRIEIEYQVAERNYTRFISYNQVQHQSKKWNFSATYYTESDLKNQSLQQSLTEDQVQTLSEAGDNQNIMNSSSAYIDSYSENKILYRKIVNGTEEIFEFSNNPQEELYNVKFSFVGANNGNYKIANNQTINKIYEYIPPIAGIKQGDYEPFIKLVAPEKLQITNFSGGYNSEKTFINLELAVSNKDYNLFSNIDDYNNVGIATDFNFKQFLNFNNQKIEVSANHTFTHKNFNSIERIFNIEFNRDWNITEVFNQHQSLANISSKFYWNNIGTISYSLEKLDFSEVYTAFRNIITANLKHKNIHFITENSVLNSQSPSVSSKFIRSQQKINYAIDKYWFEGSFQGEDNQNTDNVTHNLTPISQRFAEFSGFIARGDSTKVFVKVGYSHRITDSIYQNKLTQTNQSNSIFIDTQLLKNEQRNLSIFANYRVLKHKIENIKDPSINTRILYNDHFFNGFITANTAFETASGSIAQQEFTYIEVEPGQGTFTWNDYNQNNIQELEEFEIAAFPDLATYIRVFLPSQVYLKNNRTKIAQSIILTPANFNNLHNKFLKNLQNQTSILIDKKNKRNNNFEFNPFDINSEKVIDIQTNIQNTLSFNKGKQKHSTTYSFVQSTSKNNLSFGNITNSLKSNTIDYQHLIKHIWLVQLQSKYNINKSDSEQYLSRNFNIKSYIITPKISYLFSKNTHLDIFLEYQKKSNTMNIESLLQNKIGISFGTSGKKGFNTNAEISFFKNNFSGDSYSPVAYQMLEGNQPGINANWRVFLQKNLTKYLDINVIYHGRKSENAQTIHTGNIQLRAFF